MSKRKLDIDISFIQSTEEFEALQEATRSNSPQLNNFLEALRKRDYYTSEIERIDSTSYNSSSGATQLEALTLQKQENDAFILQLIEEIRSLKRSNISTEVSDEQKALEIAEGAALEDLKYYINLRNNFATTTTTVLSSTNYDEKVQKLVQKILDKKLLKDSISSSTVQEDTSRVTSLFGVMKNYAKNKGEPLRLCIQKADLPCIEQLVKKDEYVEFLFTKSGFSNRYGFEGILDEAFKLGNDEVTNFLILQIYNQYWKTNERKIKNYGYIYLDFLKYITRYGNFSNFKVIQRYLPLRSEFDEFLDESMHNRYSFDIFLEIYKKGKEISEINSKERLSIHVRNAILYGNNSALNILLNDNQFYMDAEVIDAATKIYIDQNEQQHEEILNIVFDKVEVITTNDPVSLAANWKYFSVENLAKVNQYLTSFPTTIEADDLDRYSAKYFKGKKIVTAMIQYPQWFKNTNEKLLEFTIKTINYKDYMNSNREANLELLPIQEVKYKKGDNPIDPIDFKRINNGKEAYMINDNPKSVYKLENLIALFNNPNTNWFGAQITVRDPISNLPITSIKRIIVRIED